MEMAQALKPLGVRPITGAEITLDDGTHLTLLCETREGYTNLCRLITASHWHTRRWAREGWSDPTAQVIDGRRPGQDAIDEEPSVTLADVERCAEGLVCLSGCARDGAVASRVEAGDHPGAAAAARRLLAVFGPEHFRVELQRPFWRHDRRRNRLLSELAERLGVPCVATGNVHVHARERTALQDAMVAVRLGATLDETEPRRRGNSSHVLAPPERMAQRFREHRARGGGERPLRRAPELRPDRGPGLPLSRLRGSRRRPPAGRAVLAGGRGALSRPLRRAGAPRGGAAGDPPSRPVGLLPAAPRHARAGARGGLRGARAGVVAAPAAAGARERLERVLDRLLPHRPLAHRPDRQRAASWAASSTRSSRRCRTSTSTSRATSATC